MQYDKTNATGVIKKITGLKESFTIKLTRSPEHDNRLNCGAGWNVEITTDNWYTGFNTIFNNSKAEKENNPDPNWVFECIFTDAQAYLDYPEYRDFCHAFGYNEYEHDWGTQKNVEASRAYYECMHTAKSLKKMFTEQELNQIANWLQEANS